MTRVAMATKFLDKMDYNLNLYGKYRRDACTE